MVALFGDAATTAGLKVTTTIDSRLQLAANRAIRDTLDRLRRAPRLPRPARACRACRRRRGAERVERRARSEALRALLEDYPPLLDYESAIVLAADDVGARVFFAAHGEQTIGLDAVEWAAPFINDDVTGAKPTTVAEVLQPGDVVRFRRTRDGGWRLAQIPEVQGAFVSIDPSTAPSWR